MACDAQTLEALVASNGYFKLSRRDFLICLAGAVGGKAGFASAQAALSQATINGLTKMSDRDLLVVLASIYNSGSSQTAVNSAQSNGMAKVEECDLFRMYLSQTC